MSKALIVVDVQNDFCEGGSLAVTGGIATAGRIAEHITGHTTGHTTGHGPSHVSGADGYDIVVATRDHHIDPGPHFSDQPDFVDSWPPHCVVGTPGVELRSELAGVRFDAVFDKGEYAAAYSGFEGRAGADNGTGGTGLDDWLRAHGVTAVDVVGIATDYCVRATALDAHRAGYATTVIMALTAAVHPERDMAAELAAAGVVVS